MMEKQKEMYYYYDAHPENGLGSMIIKIDGIYCHDVHLGTYIMSYDYNLIRNMWVEALKRKKENTEETLKKINEMMERI